MKKAILFGSSGFIGSYLLQYLLKSTDYDLVTIVVRKSPGIQHPKLKILVGDYHTLPTLKDQLIADDVFIALGTTKKNTPNEVEYYQVDHDYPVLAAKMAQQNGAKAVYVVTAVGANASSGMFYIKTKGEVERDIITLNFEHTYIFRPSMILGNRQESRPLEKTLIKVFRLINPIFAGGLNKYKGIEGKDIAKAMINAAKQPTEKVKVNEWKEMNALL